MMVALLLYAYAIGERSSRRIERRCVEDVADACDLREPAPGSHDDRAVPPAPRAPRSPACSARCSRSAPRPGWCEVGVVAIDGTKVHANASQHATRDYEQIARGDPRGGRRGRRRRGRAVRRAARRRAAPSSRRAGPARLAARGQAPAWMSKRAEEARPIPRSRPDRLKEAKRRLEEEHEVECRANADYEAYRARGRMKDGRRFGRPPNPYRPPETPAGKINVTDPDSRNVKTPRGWVQGYNAQAVCTEQQIVIAAEVTSTRPTSGTSNRWSTPPSSELAAAGDRATRRRWCSPTPATGTRRRWRRITGGGIAGADPARRRQAQGRSPGLGRRPLRVHAPRARHRARRRALRQAPGHDRARVRAHQVQPPDATASNAAAERPPAPNGA